MKISIITVVRNNANGVERTIRSIFGQKLAENSKALFEYIVIDGDSTDGTLDVIHRLAPVSARIVSEKDKGIYDAMNKAIAMAAGEYLLFLNAGDCFESTTSLQSLLNMDFDTDYLFGACRYLTAKGSIVHRVPSTITFYRVRYSILYHQSMLIRKSVFERFGYYDLSAPITADWRQYLLALFKHNCTYTTTKLIISRCEQVGASTLKNGGIERLLKEREYILEKEFSGFLEDYKLLHRIIRLFPNRLYGSLKRRYQERLL